MKYSSIIANKRQTFIADDMMDVVLNGTQIKHNDKDYLAILSKMRNNNMDINLQELLRTLHYYNFANTQKSGLVINIPLIASSLNKSLTSDILIKDFFVSVVSQIYMLLDSLVSASKVRTTSTKAFMDDVKQITEAKQKLNAEYVRLLKNTLTMNKSQCINMLSAKIKYAGQEYSICNFPLEFPKNNPNYENNNIKTNVKLLADINNIIERSAQK